MDQTMALDTVARSMTATALREWEVQTGSHHVRRMEREAERIAEMTEQHEEAKERVIG